MNEFIGKVFLNAIKNYIAQNNNIFASMVLQIN